MIKLQITLFCESGKYKPISTIVNIESMEYYKENKKQVQQKAIENICHKHYTSWSNLKNNGFTKVKVREYDLEKIEREKAVAIAKRLIDKRLNKPQ